MHNHARLHQQSCLHTVLWYPCRLQPPEAKYLQGDLAGIVCCLSFFQSIVCDSHLVPGYRLIYCNTII